MKRSLTIALGLLLATFTLQANEYATVLPGRSLNIPAGQTALVVYAGLNSQDANARPQLTVVAKDLTVLLNFSPSGDAGGSTRASAGRPSHGNPMPITGPATLSAKGNGYFGLRIVKTSDGSPKAVVPVR